MSLRLADAFDGAAGGGAESFRCRLLAGDNLPLMEALLAEFRGKIDLVYLDPPFDAGQEFSMEVPVGNGAGALRQAVYRDRWGTGADSYLQMLYERLALVRELLAETGSLILHVNWRVAHVAQLLLDELFGPGERRGPGAPGFRNEIIWGYGGGGSLRNAYRRKHDNLFWYTRSDRWTFNPQYRPYTEKTRQRGLTAVKGPRYALREDGATLESWWTGPEVQKILSPTARENLKYPTQKPEALLERIVLGHSNPGDLVADFFCGSGTLGAVSGRLGRRWIMADSSPQAVLVSMKRLAAQQRDLAAAGQPFFAFDVYRRETDPGAPRILDQHFVAGPESRSHSGPASRVGNRVSESGPSAGTAAGFAPGLRASDAALVQTSPAFLVAEAGKVSAVPVLGPGGGLEVRLTAFRPFPPEGEISDSLRRHLEAHPFDFIDHWAVDPDYQGEAFRHCWHASRSPRGAAVPLQSDLASRGAWLDSRPAAVKVIDVFGRETVVVLQVA